MPAAIRIAILDSVPEVYWKDDLGITDAQKFVDLLRPLNREASFDIYYTTQNQFPDAVDDFDAMLVTGSPCSVHDEQDWIKRLMDFIRLAHSAEKPLIGSCFGHQLIAKTFAGEVGDNENGWMIGNYPLHITRHYRWMQPRLDLTGLYHFNRERVTRLPEAAIAFAHGDDYRDLAFTLGDNILCFQGHPEQPKRAMHNFLAATPGLDEAALAGARDRIDRGEPDAQAWAQWLMRFLLR